MDYELCDKYYIREYRFFLQTDTIVYYIKKKLKLNYFIKKIHVLKNFISTKIRMYVKYNGLYIKLFIF